MVSLGQIVVMIVNNKRRTSDPHPTECCACTADVADVLGGILHSANVTIVFIFNSPTGRTLTDEFNLLLRPYIAS